EYLLSARGYKRQRTRVFVLLKHEHDYYSIIFNISSQQIEILKELEILDMIACEVSEPRATVNPEAIEHFVNQAAQVWCKQAGVPIDQVSKICGMCLVPDGEAKEIENLFKSINRSDTAD